MSKSFLLNPEKKRLAQIRLVVFEENVKPLKGVLNPNFRPFSFELKKLDFLK